jgi:hypothetical protein
MGSLWDFLQLNDGRSRRSILGAPGGLGKDRLDRQWPMPAGIPKTPSSPIFPWLGRN